MSDFRPGPGDVRMRGFARRTTVAEALAWVDQNAQPLPEEMVPVEGAAGRVLVRSVTSAVDVPSFVRAMMDGYAVRAADTLGASPYNRLGLEVMGESMPGRPFEGMVGLGQAVRIMTGAPLPDGADAVLPAELAESEDRHVWTHGEVSPHKHLGRIGEDIAAGTTVLAPGRVLRPQDLGVLSSIGVSRVAVHRRPRVRIVVTGNELLPAGSVPGNPIPGASEVSTRAVSPHERYRITDANGPMLGALVARDGGIPQHPGIVPDDAEAILAAMRSEADVVLVSGGSSVGQEDHAPALLARHGQLPIHGIAMRPSSPAGMGLLDGRLVLLLPGNPVSCLTAYDFFAGRAIRRLGGRTAAWPYRRISAPLARKIVSPIGRLDYVRVGLHHGRVEPLAVGGASILSSTTRADGFVIVPDDSEGYPPDTEVEVFLYDE